MTHQRKAGLAEYTEGGWIFSVVKGTKIHHNCVMIKSVQPEIFMEIYSKGLIRRETITHKKGVKTSLNVHKSNAKIVFACRIITLWWYASKTLDDNNVILMNFYPVLQVYTSNTCLRKAYWLCFSWFLDLVNVDLYNHYDASWFPFTIS